MNCLESVDVSPRPGQVRKYLTDLVQMQGEENENLKVFEVHLTVICCA